MKKTFQDLVEFIHSQPDDKAINMDESVSTQPCGCLLVHYGRSLNLKEFDCGSSCIVSYQLEIDFGHEVQLFIHHLMDEMPTNYKQVKEALAKFQAKK